MFVFRLLSCFLPASRSASSTGGASAETSSASEATTSGAATHRKDYHRCSSLGDFVVDFRFLSAVAANVCAHAVAAGWWCLAVRKCGRFQDTMCGRGIADIRCIWCACWGMGTRRLRRTCRRATHRSLSIRACSSRSCAGVRYLLSSSSSSLCILEWQFGHIRRLLRQ